MVHLCLLQDLSILCYPFNVELARFEIFVDELRLKQGHCDCFIVGEGLYWLVVCGPVLARFGPHKKPSTLLISLQRQTIIVASKSRTSCSQNLTTDRSPPGPLVAMRWYCCSDRVGRARYDASVPSIFPVLSCHEPKRISENALSFNPLHCARACSYACACACITL